MKYQPKVKNTQKYSDSQGEHVVCRGKLLLISNKQGCITLSLGGKYSPIIISETEEIEVGDWVYMNIPDNFTGIFQVTEEGKSDLGNYNKTKGCHKILVLPDQFSDKHLQAIADGKMKEGEVLLKTEQMFLDKSDRMIYYDRNGHITLFPIKQSLKKAAEGFANEFFSLNWKDTKDSFIAGAEWAKKNNY